MPGHFPQLPARPPRLLRRGGGVPPRDPAGADRL